MSKNHQEPPRSKSRSVSSKKKRRRRKKRQRRIMMFITLMLLFVIGFGTFYGYSMLSGIKHDKISSNKSELGVSKENINMLKKYDTYNKVTNIVLFGLDQRSEDEPSRSDAVMIVSIDKAHKKVKLTSVMRDSYVSIDGHGNDKLTHAYAYGGPELSIKTLNENFKLNITDYAAVNFFDMEKIIDSLGGVNLDIKQYEVKEINKYIKEIADITGTPYTPLSGTGSQTLSGRQALSYTRIRSVGNGDFERTSRQRIVLQALLSKIKEGGILGLPKNISKLAPMVRTSLGTGEMMGMGLSLFLSGTTEIETARIPVDGTFPDGGKMIKGTWYLPFDKEKNIDYLHKYIYEDIHPNK
ncbi:MAG: LCP family protein [Clostridium cadaveris]|uniref:LCP family protein n=1 Tax=Clostridium cadaveris TaxID=1529 RepID=UPI000C06F605|nr:LCP family protein [Clostridium cadaveris]MDY4948247.1 LCP family protein [Clostridium cadaveris]